MIRDADRREVEALGLTSEEAVKASVAGSDHAYAQWIGGKLVAFWGWRQDSVLTGTASVWMLSAPDADSHRITFARESVRLRDELLAQFSTLRADVHVAHTVAVRWLEWLGFTIVAAREVRGETFYTMQRDR